MNKLKQAKRWTIAFLLLCLCISASPVIQTQETNWDGISAELLEASCKNEVLTIKCKLRNTGSQSREILFAFQECFLMDAVNQKKYYALKDADGIYIAGPQFDNKSGGRFWFSIAAKESKTVWVKFPVPADHPSTATISIPGIIPFEEVPLGR